MSKLDKEILKRIQGSIPINSTPYKEMAEELGISQAFLFERIKELMEKGYIRSFGAALNHRKIGYEQNVMVAWKVRQENILEAAKIMVEYKAISHCYERATAPGFPYNLYTMIHCKIREECLSLIREISSKTGIADFIPLFTKREFKKLSMNYF